jgi:glutamate-1-semialdehyde 2,1-aminomutase
MIGAIIQARCESTRFPNKIIEKFKNSTLIEILLSRVKLCKKIDKIIVVTSDDKRNQKLIKILKKNNINYLVGSKNNVLERYYLAAKKYKIKTIIRLTGDNPLIDPFLIDQFVNEFKKNNIDYLADSNPPTYPDGMDIEVFNFQSLEKIYLSKSSTFEKEHVTTKLINSRFFKKKIKKFYSDYSFIRLTVDEKKDLKTVYNVLKFFYPKINFKLKDIINLYKKKPKLFDNNKSILRNEGAYLNEGQKLWKRAKEIIPGGNMFISKRPDLFLPKFWPSYYEKAKGCNIWGLDKKKYIDFNLMGVGTNLLGYSRKEIDNSVHEAINKGNMSSLNCQEEVLLAEKLVDMHPWSAKAKFARTGGEANAMAIRIARSYSKRDNIAVCGYHGWHDWYLSANLNNKGNDQLKNHLLPGLGSSGVLKNMKNSVFTFEYNNINQLIKIIKQNNIGTIFMEVSRSFSPKNNFLEQVRDLANKNKIVLIFDECSSGFRETFGGLHLKYNVNPDICMFGKALGNGYAITAIIGRDKIMSCASKSFISSTFWSERIGYVAALSALKTMEKNKSWEYVTDFGKKIKKAWSDLARKHELLIQIYGLDALPSFSINSPNFLKYKTYITQEMLKHNYLASNSVYVSTAHKNHHLRDYLVILDKIFKEIKKCEEGFDITKLLDGPICESSFKRIN